MTRAVRMALAASVAALALGASGAAFAGDCQAPSAMAAPCAPLAVGIDTAPVIDLTVVGADAASAAFAPPVSTLALVDYATGDVVIDNADPITEFDAYSSIAIGGYSSEGNVSITNRETGTLLAFSYLDATGIVGYATVGDVAIDNAGTVGVVAYENAIGLYGYSGAGDVSIDNSGAILAVSYDGLADAIFASGADVSVTNSGDITANGYTWSAGIEAQGTGQVTVGNSGEVYATTSNLGTAFGIYATGADVSVDNSGSIEAQGYLATGIEAQSEGDLTVTNGGEIIGGSVYTQYDAYSGNTRVYGSMVGTGINATSNGTDALVSVTNSGDIAVQGYYGGTGISATSGGQGGIATVTNTGSIYASQYSKYGYGAYGIVASGDGGASVDNAGGTILAVSGGEAIGAAALSFAGDASVSNSGDIIASSEAMQTYSGTALLSFAANGEAFVDNSGNAVALADNAARAIYASGQQGATVTNSGTLYASGKYAYGVYAVSYGGDVNVTNTEDGEIGFYSYVSRGFGVLGVAEGDVNIDNAGLIEGYAYGQSAGAFGVSLSGDVNVTNSGSISVATGGAVAMGVFARADYGTASVDNSGDIFATTVGVFPGYYGDVAYGILARGTYANVSNSGNIEAEGYLRAVGIAVNSLYDSAVTTTGGSITVRAPGEAIGIDIYSAYGAVAVSNASDIGVEGYVLGATGINAYAHGDVTVGNSGDIQAVSVYGDAIGLYGYSLAGDVTIDNSGEIVAISYGGLADGIFASGADVTVTNSGQIGAGGYTWSAGIEAQATGQVTVDNSGEIYALGVDVGPAFGIYATGADVVVGNSGSIEAQGAFATGIEAQSEGDLAVTNSGDIIGGSISAVYDEYSGNTYVSGSAVGIGINATSNGTGALVSVTNSGDITAQGYYGGTGISVTSGGQGGIATVANTGTIYASQYNKYGYGAYGIVASGDGGATVNNAGGTITVDSAGTATGAAALSFAGDAGVTNSGDITVSNDAVMYYGAYGIVSFAANGHAFAGNSGAIDVTTKYVGAGIDASGQQGSAATNSGDITVDAWRSYGIRSESTAGDATAHNSGSIYASYSGGMFANSAFGVVGSSAQGNVALGNSGDITTHAESQSVGMFGISTYGDVTVGNSGTIDAYTYANTAAGVLARADEGTALVQNSGTITTEGYYGYSLGILASGDLAVVGNAGTINANAYYSAYGILASSAAGSTVTTSSASNIRSNSENVAFGIAAQTQVQGDSKVQNGGKITVSGGLGAVGIQSYAAYGAAMAANAGTISATSEYGIAIGMTAYAVDGDSTATNAGTITSSGDFAAYGIASQSYLGSATATNSGSIQASSGLRAYGIMVSGYGDTTVNNSGRVVAIGEADDAFAAAVLMESLYGASTLNNSGTISASGVDGVTWAVYGGDQADIVNNSGRITGAVSLGGGNDVFNNRSGGVWDIGATTSTDFGAGNDTVNNLAGGTILMNDGAMTMGGGTGNAFNNAGMIRVSGDSAIDMGAGNTLAFTNTGAISMWDGAPDDAFTLHGNLGGKGALNIDLNLATRTADLFHVVGNVASGSTQTVNVDFRGAVPTTAHTSTLFATVTGTSTADAFVAGPLMGWSPGNFLDLGVTVSSEINAANTSPDKFYVDVDVNGLNDTGTIAATVATGAAGMLNSQIGTFKQRMGVNPYGDAGKVMSAFFRAYTSEGDVNPGHVAANFGQGGNFAYDQSVWGREVGVNANLFGDFHAGITLGTADGRQRLTGNGVGQNRMDGMTWGIYGTWFAPQGFYVDVSGRWMAVDVRSVSAAGALETRAHTGAWNVEAGYQWTLGNGLVVVPQLQYTRTEVEDVRTIFGDRANFQSHGGTSTRGRVGIELSKTFETAGGMRITPYGSINAIREFDGEMGYTVADNFFGATSTKGTSSMAELGLGAQKGGWGFTLGANWVDGGAYKRTVGGQAIVRFAW